VGTSNLGSNQLVRGGCSPGHIHPKFRDKEVNQSGQTPVNAPVNGALPLLSFPNWNIQKNYQKIPLKGQERKRKLSYDNSSGVSPDE